MQQPIPVALLAKLHDPTSLTVSETRRLTLWAQALNRCKQELSPKLLSIILMEIMTIIQLQGSSTLTLKDLLFWLDQQGCQLLHQEDPAHMDWRESLSDGDQIECNGKVLQLGKQISVEKEVEDTYKIFELADDDNWVVKIAHNRFRLLIEDQQVQNEKEHWGVRFVETIANLARDEEEEGISGLDQRGRCVVIEKLFFPFDQYEWTSQELKLTEEEEKRALVFANHLFCMIQWKASAQNLSLAHLMWDKEGVLKSTRLLKKGAANYNEWETYCVSAANGNPYVLSFLMNVSKLSEHEMARYYRDAVEYTLETGETDLIGRPLPMGHRQDDYEIHVKNLCKQAQELRQNCLTYLIAHLRRKKAYSYKQEDQLQKAIAEQLLKIYRASHTPGRFSPSLQQEVIRKLSEPSLKTVASPLPFDEQTYYQEKHTLMMKYNQAVLKDVEKLDQEVPIKAKGESGKWRDVQ